MKKPSPAMMRVLQNLYAGRDPWLHISGAAAHGGAHGTQLALLRRGWVTWDKDRGLLLTDAGRALCQSGGKSCA